MERLHPLRIALTPDRRERKRRACRAYASQLGFQFGGPERLDALLADAQESFRCSQALSSPFLSPADPSSLLHEGNHHGERMRLILSRKGFDAALGGVASPIFPNGAMASLPIPLAGAPVAYAQINKGPDGSLGPLVADLTRGAITGATPAHLDPDLARSALPRRPGWRPAFGQTGVAATHLERCGVDIGDVFLFFGWFRAVQRGSDDRWRYAPKAPKSSRRVRLAADRRKDRGRSPRPLRPAAGQAMARRSSAPVLRPRSAQHRLCGGGAPDAAGLRRHRAAWGRRDRPVPSAPGAAPARRVWADRHGGCRRGSPPARVARP